MLALSPRVLKEAFGQADQRANNKLLPMRMDMSTEVMSDI